MICQVVFVATFQKLFRNNKFKFCHVLYTYFLLCFIFTMFTDCFYFSHLRSTVVYMKISSMLDFYFVFLCVILCGLLLNVLDVYIIMSQDIFSLFCVLHLASIYKLFVGYIAYTSLLIDFIPSNCNFVGYGLCIMAGISFLRS